MMIEYVRRAAARDLEEWPSARRRFRWKFTIGVVDLDDKPAKC